VATRSQAALAGSAVADVIHLLAELIENATTLSPPYTSVRVSGETVASGFTIEVEDRGLGISPPRLAELNERLANPPEFNPSESEQLGLFVVSQLAKRHGIRVMLKASPYGGTTAVVLIPGPLVVAEGASRAGLPGEPAAIGVDPHSPDDLPSPRASDGNGRHAAGPRPGAAGFLALRDAPGADAPGLSEAPGLRISGPLRRSAGITAQRAARGAHRAGPRRAAGGGTARGADDLPMRHSEQAAAAEQANGTEQPAFDMFTPRRDPGPHPGASSAPYLGQPGAFPEWTGRSVAGSPAGSDPLSPAAPAGPPTPMTPVAAPRAGKASGPPWEPAGPTGSLPVPPADGQAGSRAAGGDGDGLPRRIRQASLAPQLRASPPHRQTPAAAYPGPASGPTPTEIRQTMSALQRGWQEGRSQRGTGPGPADLPSGPGGQDVSSAATDQQAAAADEPGGESDGA
jgi:hypothetical protein